MQPLSMKLSLQWNNGLHEGCCILFGCYHSVLYFNELVRLVRFCFSEMKSLNFIYTGMEAEGWISLNII